MEAHLGSDLVEGPGQEVGGAHPRLEGSERVFDGLSSHAHGDVLWLPLLLDNFDEFVDLVARYTGADHPLTEELNRYRGEADE